VLGDDNPERAAQQLDRKLRPVTEQLEQGFVQQGGGYAEPAQGFRKSRAELAHAVLPYFP